MSVKPSISVIISTYNATEWLQKVLWGYRYQDTFDFELIIADDGSTPATKKLIESSQKEVSVPIKHVWQEDQGFQKSMILNKAIQEATSEYILMSDGDCIPRHDFVKVHLDHRERGYFLSGGYYMLSLALSKKITLKDIEEQRCFDTTWLHEQGQPSSLKDLKLSSGQYMAKVLNAITPTNPSWNGHNASGWKSDILAVNGFDERMQYGGQDRELGERLRNNGIKSKQLRYSAICIHLDHPRGYKTPETLAKNKKIRETTRKEKKTWTDFGLIKSKNK